MSQIASHRDCHNRRRVFRLSETPMNTPNQLPVAGALPVGSDPCLSGASLPCNRIRAARYRYLLPLCAGSLMIARSLALDVGDITTDSIQTGDAQVAGLEYAEAVSIGTINAMISGTSTGHNSFGIKSNSAISINSIASGSTISGSSARNYSYGIYTTSGDISITNPIEGAVSATVNTATAGNSAYGYGIFTKSGNVTLGGLAEGSAISVRTAQTTTGGRLYGIETENNGNIAINGAVAGTIEVLSYGNTAYGMWAKEGGITIDSFAPTGSLTVTGSFNAYGIYAYKDIVMGDIDGNIDVSTSTGNFAYGINSSGRTDYDRSSVTLGNVNGSIIASSGGSNAFAVIADYGRVTLGDIGGTVSASSVTEIAYGLRAKYDVVLGDLAEGAVLSASTQGKDAYAVYAGYVSGRDLNFITTDVITMGNVNGSISATADTGYAVALFSRSDIEMGDIGANGEISAVSTGSADAIAVWGVNGDVAIGVIDGSIDASSASGKAYAITGLGLDLEIGSTGSVSAEGTGEAYALFSGCHQGGGFRTYNIADTIVLHAGAQINGAIDIGGSGATGYDNITLLGGDAARSGMLDTVIKTTINTINQDESTRKSDVRLTVGNAAGDAANWTISSQHDLFTGLTVNRNAVVASDDASLSIKDGGFIMNQGLITGSGEITVTANSSLTTGSLVLDAATNELVTVSTGFGADMRLTLEEGATIGTTIRNDSDSLHVIRQDAIKGAVGNLFSDLTGTAVDLDNYSYSYALVGNIALSDKLVVSDNEQYRIGEGATVELASGSLPDDAIILEGGTLNTAATGETRYTNAQISGSAGLWIADDGQELAIVRDGVIGFDSRHADITVDARATLTGSHDAANVTLNSGSLEVRGDSASLGRDGGIVTVKSNTTFANNATVLSRVEVEEQATLKGAGTFADDVTLAANAMLHVGNSPGRQLYQGNLNLGSAAALTFTIDGVVAASATHAGAGTYSTITVSGAGHTVTLAGGNTIKLEIGSGILKSPTAEFSLTLISYEDGAMADPSFNEGNFTTILSGQSNLIDPGFTWELLGNALVLHGTVNRQAASDLIGADASRYANALWSSSGVVRGFGLKAASHLDYGTIGKTNFWVDGIGDFMSMDNDGGVNGFDSNHGGYALGAERRFNTHWSGGFAYGQSFGENKSDDGLGKTDQTANMIGLQARYERETSRGHLFFIDGSFAYGRVKNKAHGHLGNDWNAPSSAEWDDNVFALSFTGNLKIKLGERSTITPFTGIEFVNGSQQSFSQQIGRDYSRFSGGSLQRWIIPVGATWQGVYCTGSQYLIPELTVAYQGDVARRDPSIRTTVFGQETKFHGSSPARNAVIANTGLRWVINPKWSASAYYNLGYSSGMTHHALNAGVTCSF